MGLIEDYYIIFLQVRVHQAFTDQNTVGNVFYSSSFWIALIVKSDSVADLLADLSSPF